MLKSSAIFKFFWLWLPLVFIFFQSVLEISFPGQTLSTLHSEGGPHETLEFAILVIAFCVGISTLFHLNWKTQKPLVCWVMLAVLCCFYVAGEEVSWGQHLLDWSTPEFWAQINDQGETNLHNTSSWFDQKPRIILQLGALVGGLLIPFLLRFKPDLLPQRFAIIYPSAQLSVTALFVVFINLTDRIDSVLHNIVIFERASEVEELYLFYFVLLYLIALRRRVMQRQR